MPRLTYPSASITQEPSMEGDLDGTKEKSVARLPSEIFDEPRL